MANVTDEQLAELERLADAATPGPWEANSDHHNNVYVDAMNQGDLGLKVQLLDLNMQGNEEDAAFIAASRTAIPALLADLRETKSNLREARASLDRANEQADIWRRKRDRAYDERDAATFSLADHVLKLDEARRLLERARPFVMQGQFVSSEPNERLLADIDAALGSRKESLAEVRKRHGFAELSVEERASNIAANLGTKDPADG